MKINHGYKCGDTIKIKILGMKRKVYILTPHDVIDEDCLMKYVLDWQPMCYNTTISACDFRSSGWIKTAFTKNENEKVCDDHTGRVYIRIIR